MSSKFSLADLKARMLDHLPYKIMWMDSAGRIIYANTMFLKRLGYTKSEIENLTIFDVNPATTIKTWEQHWKVVRQKEEHHFQTVHQTKSGALYDVAVTAYFFSNNGKNIIAAIVDDIATSRFYQNLLQDGEQMAKMGGWQWNLQDGTLVATEQALTMFSVNDQKALLPGSVIHFFKEPQKLEQLLKQVMRKGGAFDEVLQLQKKGAPKYIRCVTKPLKHQEKIIALIGIYQDVTAAKQKETQLQELLAELSLLQQQLASENQSLKEEIKADLHYDNIICQSLEYQKVLQKVTQVAPTDTTVLITGESGTGKELLARAVHDHSRRSEKPFIKVNAAALPEALIESELFGHQKGAFTGAIADKVGKFILADGGTLFLDEIGELPISLQPKLLRALQEGEFDKVGATQTQQVDVRIVAATNRDLEKMVKEGTFREDLFYRLNVFPIFNIPLRERKDDIPLLATYFLNKYAHKSGKVFNRLSKKTLALLMEYPFPGNIRELQNLIERAVILEKGPTLQPGAWFSHSKQKPQYKGYRSLDAVQREYILKVLESTNWRVSGPKGAATILGLKDKTLFAKLKRLGIERKTKFA